MRARTAAVFALLVGVSRFAFGQTGSPAGPVPIGRLTERRNQLLDRIGNGVAVLQSARVQDMEGEDFPQASDFRQDDDFFYLTGLEIPGSMIVLVGHRDGPDQVVLFIPARNEAEEQWTGLGMSTTEAAAQSGINDVRTSETASDFVADVVRNNRPLFVKIPGIARQLCQSQPRPEDCTWLFLQPLRPSGGALEDVRQHLAALRLIKDADELRRMKRAIDITAEAIRSALRHAKPGQWEYEIEARIEHVFRSSGAERVGFPSIVASGPNATTLHYDQSRRRTQAGDLVVLDLGAEFGYYTADVSRTLPVSGKFTARQRALYDLVLATQQAAIDSVRPGMTLLRLDDIARAYMRSHSGKLCGARTCDEYFIHAIGHWLGMDVHDPGSVATPFVTGMVLTVEPGLYLAGEGIGIRIEDDVVVTSTGHEVLSSAAPRAAEDIELLMSGGN